MLTTAELSEVEAAFRHAVDSGDAGGLHVLGHGEISVVLGWPPDAPAVACKRLPRFASRPAFDAYAEVVRRYVDALGAHAVRVVPTDVVGLPCPDGSVAGYHLQPVQPSDRLAVSVVRAARVDPGHPVLPAVVDAVVRSTTGRLGVDAQLSNWAWDGSDVHQFDLTTPFLLDDRGRPSFDLAPFLAVLPAVVRPVVGRQMRALVQRWMTPRGALVDLVANLFKEHLDDWVPVALGHANAVVSAPIGAEEALRVHRGDRRLWPVLLRLEKAQRWWTVSVRRRPYDVLLPERTTYG